MMAEIVDLSTQQAIRELHKDGATQREIASTLGVSKATAWKYGRVEDHPQRLALPLHSGTIVVGSDAHYWPGKPSTAHRGFCFLISQLHPDAIVMNGDVMDGATVSSHPTIGWENRPSLKEEMDTVTERLNEIRSSVSYEPRLIWTLGNHDMRFENRLSKVAPEYAGIIGMHLKDHFPDWDPAWSFWVNNDVVIKHRYKGGDHAAFNNCVKSGKTIVTGHLHSLQVTAYSDYNGTRWGVDTGTLAEPYGDQFIDYTEDNPVNWRSGFVVLTFREGRLLWPEVCYVVKEGVICFRGEKFDV